LIVSAAAIVLAVTAAFAVYKFLDVTVGIRLSKDEELMGSDLAIHKIGANPEDATTRFG